jgi:hypothetical protein
LRDRPLGRLALLLGVLLLAFVALQTCASREGEIDFKEAEEIAREEVDFEPEEVHVGPVPRGTELFWGVSLWTENAAGIREECATVLVDMDTGETEVNAC